MNKTIPIFPYYPYFYYYLYVNGNKKTIFYNKENKKSNYLCNKENKNNKHNKVVLSNMGVLII